MDLSKMTPEQLKTIKQNAERLLGNESEKQAAETRLREVEAELERRRRGSLEKKRGNPLGKKLVWSMSEDGQKWTLVYDKEQEVALIRKVANHSNNIRDVYQTEIFGKPDRNFEYIEDAKQQVKQKAAQEIMKKK